MKHTSIFHLRLPQRRVVPMKHTSIFHLRLPPKESCSKQAPKQGNNKSLNMEDNLPSTDNMLIDFGSGDIFGDLE